VVSGEKPFLGIPHLVVLLEKPEPGPFLETLPKSHKLGSDNNALMASVIAGGMSWLGSDR